MALLTGSPLPPSQPRTFPREARLLTGADFEGPLRRPEIRLRSGPLRLNAVSNRMQSARLGMVLGRKAVPRATARNRIKRVIRESFRSRRSDLPALDIVVRVTGPVERSELRDRLEGLFTELERRVAST